MTGSCAGRRCPSASSASTVGLGLVAIGTAFAVPTANDATSAVLAAVLYIITLPIGASLIGRASYLSDEPTAGVDVHDGMAQPRSPTES